MSQQNACGKSDNRQQQWLAAHIDLVQGVLQWSRRHFRLDSFWEVPHTKETS
jgi:hypothetical protein